MKNFLYDLSGWLLLTGMMWALFAIAIESGAI
ncbi:hypothetical protein THIOSC13_810001 [uncultured Thiomicrorhabdus sp.]